MRRIDLTQGSAEWDRWRHQGLGCSDAPAVVGASLYLSPRQLWEQKTGKAAWSPSTYAQRRGTRLEPEARRRYQERTGLLVRPACVEHDGLPWLRASLDGLSFAGDAAAEIKCLKKEHHTLALGGAVPHWYRPQLDHALLVTGLAAIDYVSYSEHSAFAEADRLAVVSWHADPDRIAAYLETARAFWWHVERQLPLTRELRDGLRFGAALTARAAGVGR